MTNIATPNKAVRIPNVLGRETGWTNVNPPQMLDTTTTVNIIAEIPASKISNAAVGSSGFLKKA